MTGSRADYGLLRWLIHEIARHSRLELQVAATGMHFIAEFGSTFREIEEDGFSIDAAVDTLLANDSPAAITKALGLGVIGFSDAFQKLRPDVVVVLGDRFEILAAAQAALLALIPIAHVHGGELTEGAVDDSVRHAITKMSHLHFAATEDYRRRIIQMGEEPHRVFTVGAPGVDNLKRMALLDRNRVEAAVGLKLDKPFFLVTFHPETLGRPPLDDISALLQALDEFSEARFVFTQSNADAGGRAIAKAIDAFVSARRTRAVLCPSLGHLRYLSALKQADVVIGNSSSGIIEAPAAGVPTVNIGDRQKGRLRSDSVIDCSADATSIAAGIRRALTPEFVRTAKVCVPAYGAGNSASQMCEILASWPADQMRLKAFHDLA